MQEGTGGAGVENVPALPGSVCHSNYIYDPFLCLLLVFEMVSLWERGDGDSGRDTALWVPLPHASVTSTPSVVI